jgi:hypothetical protein
MAAGPAAGKQVAGEDEWETVSHSDEWETVSGPSAVALAPPPPLPTPKKKQSFQEYWESHPRAGSGDAFSAKAAATYGQELIGAGKSALNTTYQALRLPSALMAKGVVAVAPKGKSGEEFVSPPLIAPTPEALRPTDDAQVIGTAFERIAETLVAPELWASRLPMIVKAIGGMASQAGVNWLQGGTPEEVRMAAYLGAVRPGGKAATAWIKTWKPETVAKLVDRIGKTLPYLGAYFGHKLGGSAEMMGAGWLAGQLGRGAGGKLATKAEQALMQLRQPGLPFVARKGAGAVGIAAQALPGVAQSEIQLPGVPPTGKVVIRRPGQKPEIVDAYVDAEGRVKLVR